PGLFLAVSAGFVLFCNPPCAIWNDSSCSTIEWMTRPNMLAHWENERASLMENPGRTLGGIVREVFGSMRPGGYRPFSSLYVRCALLFMDPYQPSLALRCLVATVYGAFAVSLFLV